MYLDIAISKYIVKSMYLDLSKRPTIWNGWSSVHFSSTPVRPCRYIWHMSKLNYIKDKPQTRQSYLVRYSIVSCKWDMI